MQIKKQISILKRYFEAAWISAQFCFMLRKINRSQAESTENRQGILWSILCSLMSVQGIFTYIKGYVEMTKGNTRGIEMMTEGMGAAIMAATMKQYSGVLVGEKKRIKKF